MQTRRKNITLRALIGLSVVFVLFMALGVHLYYVTDNFYSPKGPQLQLARIDMHKDLSEQEIACVRSAVDAMPSVSKTYYNADDDILVYAYTVGEQTQQNIYQKVLATGNISAKQFIPDAKTVASGCPVRSNETSGLLALYKNIFSLIL